VIYSIKSAYKIFGHHFPDNPPALGQSGNIKIGNAENPFAVLHRFFRFFRSAPGKGKRREKDEKNKQT
jgi:hypothetical protein